MPGTTRRANDASAFCRDCRASSSWPRTFLNFLLVALLPQGWPKAPSWSRRAGRVYVTVLPSEFATGASDCGASPTATCCSELGAVGLAAVVLVRLPVPDLGAASRPTSAARSSPSERDELASLQVGLLSTVMQTLSMRDAMTARHSAAVARYAREVARLLGMSRARAGPRPYRRAAARHRQVHLPGLDPVRRPQADRRGVGDRQAPSGAGRQARAAHRGLWPGRGHHHRPPRARRRQGLSARHRRRARSRSAHASSRSPTPTT